MGEIKKVVKAIFQKFKCPQCGCYETSGSYPELWMCHNRDCRATGKNDRKGKR